MKLILISTYIVFLFLPTILLAGKKKAPNIILILTDDQGYGDISAHGSPDVSTPHMDKLKSQSISLSDFQVSPTCAPTRSAIMTGRHPFKNGVTHTILERERMALGITTLSEVLKRKNYMTGIFGKWHLGDQAPYQPDRRGFDEVFIHGGGGIGQGRAFPGTCADVPGNRYFDPTIKHNGRFVKTVGFCTDVFFSQALAWIKEQSEEDKPFFAYISTNAPHAPFIAPEKYKAKFIEKDYLKRAQGFYGMIENIDDNLGVLMEKLDAWNISDHTILIFMSDNGKTWAGGQNKIADETYNAGMKGYKSSVHEGGTRVPFFIRWPGKFKAGKTIDVLLNHYDILPTIADIAHIDISDISDIDGQSFLPYLTENKFTAEERYRFVHTGRWEMNPKNFSDTGVHKRWIGTPESSNPDNHKYHKCAVRNERFRFVNNVELYDLSNDPGETTNVALEYPEVVADMRKAYDSWWSEVRPFMVNEEVSVTTDKPFWIEYAHQKDSIGIKDWIVPNID